MPTWDEMHVLAMPRWESSAGAVKEVAYAKAKGVPVVFHIMDLPRESAAL